MPGETKQPILVQVEDFGVEFPHLNSLTDYVRWLADHAAIVECFEASTSSCSELEVARAHVVCCLGLIADNKSRSEAAVCATLENVAGFAT